MHHRSYILYFAPLHRHFDLHPCKSLFAVFYFTQYLIVGTLLVLPHCIQNLRCKVYLHVTRQEEHTSECCAILFDFFFWLQAQEPEKLGQRCPNMAAVSFRSCTVAFDRRYDVQCHVNSSAYCRVKTKPTWDNTSLVPRPSLSGGWSARKKREWVWVRDWDNTH